MKSHPNIGAICALAAVLFVVRPALGEGAATPDFVFLTPEQIEFPSAPGSGLSQVLLAGDPSQPGLYVIRVAFAPGVTSPPHFHDQDRFITVISGVWHFGMGASGRCEETVPLPAGSFAVHPKGAAHFDGACGEETVVVEIRGLGPVTTTRI